MTNETKSNITIEVPESLVRWFMKRYFWPVAFAGGVLLINFLDVDALQERREPQSNESHKTATP